MLLHPSRVLWCTLLFAFKHFNFSEILVPSYLLPKININELLSPAGIIKKGVNFLSFYAEIVPNRYSNLRTRRNLALENVTTDEGGIKQISTRCCKTNRQRLVQNYPFYYTLRGYKLSTRSPLYYRRRKEEKKLFSILLWVRRIWTNLMKITLGLLVLRYILQSSKIPPRHFQDVDTQTQVITYGANVTLKHRRCTSRWSVDYVGEKWTPYFPVPRYSCSRSFLQQYR